MNQDGAMAAVDAKALAQYGTDRLGMRYPVHLTAWSFGQMSALMSYLMAPIIRLAGLSVTSARIPSLIISLVGLISVYCFSREALGEKISLAVLFLTAISPWHIIQSRWALDCNLFPHFLSVGMLFLLLGTKKKYCYYISMLFFGLSMYCYGISIYTVPLFLVFSAVYLISGKRAKASDILICSAIYLLISWPFLLCMIINFFGLETIKTPFFTIPFFPYTIRSGDILFFSENPFSQLLLNLRCTFTILFQKYNGAPCNEVRGFGTLYVLSLPFIPIGALKLLKHFRNNTGAALTWFMFLTGLFDGIITANVNINRINLIFYPLLIFAGMGLCEAISFFHILSPKAGKISGALIIAGFIASFSLFTFRYFTSYADEISTIFMEDFGQALVSVKETDSGKYCITPDAQYDGFWYVSEILTQFYHDTDAKFYQSSDFSSKYEFRNPDPNTVPDEDTVYVITEEYLNLFDDTDFTISQFGNFYTAICNKPLPAEA
ncbi:MAG: glycosyltransferase family 39 protein [Eubacteriales bacterium]|nr:glycosyltransferase family 39 protein [Eubacteriales bacterium]